MADNFFQERFLRNLKFYETTTVEELKQKYDLLYGGIDFKSVCLVELSMIKRSLSKEKLSKNDSSINFDEYINQVDELYSRIDSMSDSVFEDNKQRIEMIIVSIKLSLNSPIYFVIDVEKFNNYDLDAELRSFIDDFEVQGNNTLIQFKEVLNHEIDKKKELIETKKSKMGNFDTLGQLNDLYLRFNSKQIDIYEFISIALKLGFTNEEKKAILETTYKMIQYNDKRSVDVFNDKISLLIKPYSDIVDIGSSIGMITKISQNIDENGRLIHGIEKNLIGEYCELIGSLNLDVVSLEFEIMKQQIFIKRKQVIDEIVKLIEDRAKSLPKKFEPKESVQVSSISEEYGQLDDEKKKLNDEKNVEQLFDIRVSVMKKQIVQVENQIEENILGQLDKEKIGYLNVYVKTDLKNISEHDRRGIEYSLNQLGLDIVTLKLYKSYVTLMNQISETKNFIDMIEEEKVIEYLPQAGDMVQLIFGLFEQYIDARGDYLESKNQVEDDLSVDDMLNGSGNILLYLETDDGITQVEERMFEDSEIYGKYKSAELKNVEYLINLLKHGAKNEIEEKSKPIVQTRNKDNKSYDASYGRRLSTSGPTRLAYKQIPSSVLNTDKSVFLVISAGKKVTDNSDVYRDAINLNDKVLSFISEYESLNGASDERKQEFLEHQLQHEKRLMNMLQNGRGEKDATVRR